MPSSSTAPHTSFHSSPNPSEGSSSGSSAAGDLGLNHLVQQHPNQFHSSSSPSAPIPVSGAHKPSPRARAQSGRLTPSGPRLPIGPAAQRYHFRERERERSRDREREHRQWDRDRDVRDGGARDRQSNTSNHSTSTYSHSNSSRGLTSGSRASSSATYEVYHHPWSRSRSGSSGNPTSGSRWNSNNAGGSHNRGSTNSHYQFQKQSTSPHLSFKDGSSDLEGTSGAGNGEGARPARASARFRVFRDRVESVPLAPSGTDSSTAAPSASPSSPSSHSPAPSDTASPNSTAATSEAPSESRFIKTGSKHLASQFPVRPLADSNSMFTRSKALQPDTPPGLPAPSSTPTSEKRQRDSRSEDYAAQWHHQRRQHFAQMQMDGWTASEKIVEPEEAGNNSKASDAITITTTTTVTVDGEPVSPTSLEPLTRKSAADSTVPAQAALVVGTTVPLVSHPMKRSQPETIPLVRTPSPAQYRKSRPIRCVVSVPSNAPVVQAPEDLTASTDSFQGQGDVLQTQTQSSDLQFGEGGVPPTQPTQVPTFLMDLMRQHALRERESRARLVAGLLLNRAARARPLSVSLARRRGWLLQQQQLQQAFPSTEGAVVAGAEDVQMAESTVNSLCNYPYAYGCAKRGYVRSSLSVELVA